VTEGLTIGEFARRCGLSVSALRFYDSAELLKPETVDPTNAYRIYAVEQLPTAEAIRDLRRLEMPLAMIQEFLGAPADVRRKLVDDHVAAMSARVRKAESIATALTARLSQPEECMTMQMTVDAGALGEAIDQVVPAASTDPEFPTLQTVLVEARDASLRLVATDRFRLAVRDLVARDGDGASFSALVASATLGRIRPKLDGQAQVIVRRDDNSLILGLDGGDTEIRAIPAEFPAYETFFGIDPDANSITVARSALVEALQALTDVDTARFVFESGELRVDTKVIGAYQGPDMLVGLNPRFAHYAVSAAVGPEVMIEVVDPLKPVVFRSATDSSYICMLMPIRLDAAATG
jgi:DNA polymerase III subunit beta